ncbi:uncharacterized protein KY384_009091 [Bacidia gigantensis]|uniref:uncharacterized protein n=1 Tax=Bacidia gigantensis TaxID=2732470 RepID=UPI001D0366BC|nr:uncharacterized protein KY384_009091 [Bacidia gigantensis]KAG8525447.1 hypothetical protein KY384_009091 [Bacidia gigantensis]
MTSNIVVVDTSARRAIIKTTPDKYLIDILREACKKFGRDADSYELRHNGKLIDLSRNVRLAGLTSGAKLELVLSSRSPSAVSIAIQLPEPDHHGHTRLTDKFSSNTTLWKVLRRFESEDGARRNFTGRGQPVLNGEEVGAGRLFFETPVVQILGRELSSFTDLQKNLAQLGLNSGSALLRLSFRTTETPLEDAMKQITQYFSEIDGSSRRTTPTGLPATSRPVSETEQLSVSLPKIAGAPQPLEPSLPFSNSPPEPILAPQPSSTSSDPPVPSALSPDITSDRPITIFAPPSAGTPKAAKESFNEKDFVPTIQHAKLHQSRLQAASTNKKLLSDAELNAKEKAREQRRDNIKEIEIKVRFPDQMQIVSRFTDAETADDLYTFVRNSMEREGEPITLRFSSSSGLRSILSGQRGSAKLIGDLGMTGRVLVNVLWDEGASLEARAAPVLKEDYREKAQEIEVQRIEGSVEEEGSQPAEKPSGQEEKGPKKGLPKWLKLPGKK